MKVGQMYENRRNGKLGVVEEINDEYKTVLMLDPDGKSFNVNFSTLKSNWRIYKGDVVAKTSQQVEEERKTVEREKEKLTKKRKGRVTAEVKALFINSASDVINGLVNERYSGKVSVSVDNRGCISVKKANSKKFEVWPKAHLNKFNIRISEVLFEKISDIVGELEVKFFANDAFKYSIRGFDIDRLSDVISRIIDEVLAESEREEAE